MNLHNASKTHRRQLKIALEKPYSQREAELGAGMGASDNKPRAPKAVEKDKDAKKAGGMEE